MNFKFESFQIVQPIYNKRELQEQVQWLKGHLLFGKPFFVTFLRVTGQPFVRVWLLYWLVWHFMKDWILPSPNFSLPLYSKLALRSKNSVAFNIVTQWGFLGSSLSSNASSIGMIEQFPITCLCVNTLSFHQSEEGLTLYVGRGWKWEGQWPQTKGTDDLCLASIWAWSLGFEHGGWRLSLKAGVWAKRLEFEPLG